MEAAASPILRGGGWGVYPCHPSTLSCCGGNFFPLSSRSSFSFVRLAFLVALPGSLPSFGFDYPGHTAKATRWKPVDGLITSCPFCLKNSSPPWPGKEISAFPEKLGFPCSSLVQSRPIAPGLQGTFHPICMESGPRSLQHSGLVHNAAKRAHFQTPCVLLGAIRTGFPAKLRASLARTLH